MKTGTRGLTLGLIAVLALATVAFAYGRGDGQGKGNRMAPWDNPEVAGELGLPDSQVAALKEEGESFRGEMQSLQKQIREVRQNHRALMEADRFDEAAFKQAVEEMADLHADRVRLHGDHLMRIRGILTAEQFTKLHEMRKARGRRGGPGRGFGGPPPEGSDDGPDMNW